MEKISLYIADKKVDLDTNSFILFNYTMEDLTNPTIVKNSFSKQITLKGTPANNEIFGNMHKSDRRIYQGINNVGVGYNPLRKTPFSIYNEKGEMLESGYIKLDSVTIVGGIPEYKISLYGGLGSFFYGLTYNDDGGKKTLADIQYIVDGKMVNPYTYSIRINAEEMSYAWQIILSQASLQHDKITDIYGLINFVPAYKGYPDNFDANKAYYRPYIKSRNMPNIYISSEGYSTHPDGEGGIIIEMANQHTEWEMQDLRSYLQQPAIRFACVIDAISRTNINGYSLRIDEGAKLQLAESLWLTLKLPNREKVNMSSSILLSELLNSTLSPAEYIIGYAKMMGFVFLTNPHTKVITMMSRNKFYGENTSTIDITSKIDVQSIEVGSLIDAKYMVFSTENVGELAKAYAERYGRNYGSQVINTGYEFNVSEIDLLTNFPFKGACDVMEQNLNYYVYGGDADPEYGVYENYLLKFALTEEVSWKLYRNNGNAEDEKLEEKIFYPLQFPISPYGYNKFEDFKDTFPKIQMHASQNKSEDGSNILILFNGMVELPTYLEGGFGIADVTFFLTDDNQGMLNLNGGKPCWNLFHDDNSYPVHALPSFRRSADDLSLDFGASKEVFVSDQTPDISHIYGYRWQRYIHDRYDKDGRVMRCKVNLRGMQVGQELMRNFFFFDNSIWVMNKIINHSITTNDLTECEFVKVQNIENYTNGQI